MNNTVNYKIQGSNIITSFDRITDTQDNHLKKPFIVRALNSENWYFNFTEDEYPLTIINFVNINNAIDSFFMTNINTFPLTCVEVTLSGVLAVTYDESEVLTEYTAITSSGQLSLKCVAIEYNDVPLNPPEEESSALVSQENI